MSGMLHVFLFFIFALTPPLVIFRGSVSAVWDRPCAVRDVEPKTNCPGILDRKSPNRQVINNSPLIPFGDAPLNDEQASAQPAAGPNPETAPTTDWGKALPPRGCRNPLWVPDPGKLPEPVTERADQEVRVLDGIRRGVARVQYRLDSYIHMTRND